jgi:hypothetical protein
MSSARGHRSSGSVSQNHRAQLANAYNELGKELSSSKIRVVGNYTLSKAIGEGELVYISLPPAPTHLASFQAPMAKSAWGLIASPPLE